MIRTPEVLRERLFRGVNLPQNIPFIRAYQNERIRKLIIDLNKIEQLFKKGIDINNEVTGVYSEATEIINPLKKAGTPFTYKDSGFFFDSFKIKIFIDASFTVEANDAKTDETSGAVFTLTELYGEIIGLNEQSTTKLSRALLPHFNREVRAVLFDS